MRRINLTEIIALEQPVTFAAIRARTNSRFQRRLHNRLVSGGLLSPRLFRELVEAVSAVAPDSVAILARFSVARQERIDKLPDKTRAALAEQKEVVATALTISGIDRSELAEWDVPEKLESSSFLDGLPQVRLREDPMVTHDLINFPGLNFIRSQPHQSVVFANSETTLTVILANRQPLEEVLGTDLIYYNETFKSFVMVQYKAMEEGLDNEHVFRLPSAQLDLEINRMNKVLLELVKCAPNTDADGHRLNANPFFLKLCPRLQFNPDAEGLVRGMYFPLDYWCLLVDHPDTMGPKGGKLVSYGNSRRYFDNTSFLAIVSQAWVGTTPAQSNVLEVLIREILSSGRAVALAIGSGSTGTTRRKGKVS
jgi:hypothetical protein